MQTFLTWQNRFLTSIGVNATTLSPLSSLRGRAEKRSPPRSECLVKRGDTRLIFSGSNAPEVSVPYSSRLQHSPPFFQKGAFFVKGTALYTSTGTKTDSVQHKRSTRNDLDANQNPLRGGWGSTHGNGIFWGAIPLKPKTILFRGTHNVSSDFSQSLSPSPSSISSYKIFS